MPIVVTGFEPLDILEGIHMTVSQLEEGRPRSKTNTAARCGGKGNRPAQERIAEVFEVTSPRSGADIGEIPVQRL